MHCDGLADDEAIGDEFADSLTAVGVRNLVDWIEHQHLPSSTSLEMGRTFVRVEPNLALSAANDRRRKALLRAEIDPGKIER